MTPAALRCPSPAQGCIARSPVPPREAPELLGRGQSTARFACMADVCRTRGGALSPLSPNESRKRSRGSTGAQSSWFKRHRTGHSFARRLLHLRGFALDVRQAEELVRFIDQFPPEMDKVRPRPDLAPIRARESPSVKKKEGRHRQTVIKIAANRAYTFGVAFFFLFAKRDPSRAPTSPRTFCFLTHSRLFPRNPAGRFEHPRKMRRHRRRRPPAHDAASERRGGGPRRRRRRRRETLRLGSARRRRRIHGRDGGCGRGCGCFGCGRFCCGCFDCGCFNR